MPEKPEGQENSRDWYKSMAIEPIDYIEANGILFGEGNIIKYVSRWRQKDGLLDLIKARYYLDRLIAQEQERLEKEKNRDEAL